MKATFPLLVILMVPFQCFALPGPSGPQATDSEITELLAKLSNRITETKEGNAITDPSEEVQKEVPKRLTKIANGSREARARVIYWLMRVVEDPTARNQSSKWIAAVRLLGSLKAIEAIDVLIDNLDRTGEDDFVSSIHFQPVTRTLVSIGKPAVPKLIEALSHAKPSIRSQAASALAGIGGDDIINAIKRAALTEPDEYVLTGMKVILRNHAPPTEADIQVAREASFEACPGGQVVAATFNVDGIRATSTMRQTACTRAPVEITRLTVKPDGSYFVHFRNVDPKRSVVGVMFFLLALDAKGNVEGEAKFVGGILDKPAEPGDETTENSQHPTGQLKLEPLKTYLVYFSNVPFSPLSEWHFNAECNVSNESGRIVCKEAR